MAHALRRHAWLKYSFLDRPLLAYCFVCEDVTSDCLLYVTVVLLCADVVQPLYCCPAHRYDAIIDLTRRLNASYSEARQVQLTTRRILNSLFPSWLPGAFKVRHQRLRV